MEQGKTDIPIEEMAEQLSAIQARRGARWDDGPKSQLLCVMEALRLFTDERHGLTAGKLRDIVGLCTGSRPSEQKLLSDVHALAESDPFGMEVSIPGRGQAGGIRCARSTFTSEQAMALINMVQTCKFATPGQRAELVEALGRTVSAYQRSHLVRDVIVDRREVPDTQDVFEAAGVASEAIRSGKKMAFAYCARNLQGDDVPIEGGPEGADELVETPVALVYAFDNYYVETWATRPDGNKALWDRRLDRIRNPRVVQEQAEDRQRHGELREAIEDKVAQTFDMFGGGEPLTLFLETKAEAAKYVYDRFGALTAFHNIRRDEEGRLTTGIACVAVRPGLTFYRWLFGLAGSVKVVAPPRSELAARDYWNDNPAARKAPEELLEDYEQAVAGLQEQARKLAAAYGWEEPAAGGASK